MTWRTIGVLFLVFPQVASALPTVGAVRPSATVVDADNRSLDIRAINGRPILIVYESKDAATQNALLKTELAKLAAGDKYRTQVSLVPVADVEGYDYWPIRGFVKSAIRDESAKINATIYCDWNGSFRRSVGLTRNKSSVILIGRDARVLFASEGPLPATERTRLISLLRHEIEDDS